MKRYALSSLIVLTALSLASCAPVDNISMVDKSAAMMGTIVEIKIPAGTPRARAGVRSAIEKAFREVARIEDVFSVFKENSEISKINSLAKGEVLKISPEVFTLIERSVEYSKKTDGAFDITVKPLVDLWRERGRIGKMPQAAEISKALNKTGYDKIILDKDARTISFKEEGMAVDFGGVAKGYAADRVAALLEEDGIGDALINIGGAMYCLGGRSPGKAWRIGIRDPGNKSGLLFEIAVRDMAVNTSGGYERYFVIGGKRYSHIIDPRTGYTANEDVMSATVVAKNSTDSDMLATALCVLGKDAFKVLNGAEGEEALLAVNRNHRMELEETDGFKRYK